MAFFINDVFNGEGNSGTTAFTFTVTRTNPTGSASVDYTTALAASNPATPGVDFVATSGTLNFLPGETSKTITVLVNGDTTFEPDEYFNVILSNPIGDTIGRSTGLGGILNDDAAPPTVSILPTPGISLPEGNSGTTAFTFTVALSTSPTQPVTVNYSTNDGTATLLDNDYQDNDGTLTFLPGGPLTQTVTVLVNGDTQLEPTETFTVSLNSATNALINPTANVAVGTIVNDELVYTLTASDSLTVLEGNSGSTLRTFVINRLGVTTQASTLNFDLAGSATLGTDYTLVGITGSGVSVSGNTIQFAAGATSAVITLAIQGDTQIENDETILLTIADPANLAAIVGSPISTTIVNDDFAPTLPIVSVSVSDGDVSEAGNNPGTFTITRTGDTTDALIVSYIVGGTAAINGSDYTPTLTGTATIPAGQSSVTITITPIDDLEVEGDETVNLTLTSSTAYTLGVAAASLTIVDNDFPPPPLPTVSIAATDPTAAEAGTDPGVYTITRTGDTSQALTVSYTVGGTATNGTDYTAITETVTIPAGQSSVNVIITPIDDLDVEGDETVNLTLTSSASYTLSTATTATVTIADNDVDVPPPPLPTVSIAATDPTAAEAGTDPGVYTITRTGDTSQALTVSYTVGGTATNGTDYTAITETVTIPAGQSSVNVIITPIDDLDVEGDETVNLTLTSSASYTLSTATTATVAIADNDVDSPPPPLPTISIDNVSLSEGNNDLTAFTFTVSLSTASSSVVTVDYATIDGSATASSDYTAIPLTTLTFAPGQTSQTITVNVQGDLDVETDETFFVNLSNAAGATIAVPQGLGTILNDDLPVVVNNLPIALDDQARVTEGQAVTIAVLDNDSDPDGDPLTIDGFTNPQVGTLVRNQDGTFTYQASLDFAGTDSFTYQISDGQGGMAQATVTITIDPLNLIGTDCCDRLIGTNTGNRIEGRGGNDWLDGRGGNDWLNGGAGWDTLIGGLGADRFVFDSGAAFNPCSLGVDTIVDFDRTQGDAIVLSRTTFTALSSLVGDSLTADDFAVINSACDGASLAAASVARIVFNQATGDLFYNQNGSCCGFGSGGRFATLSVNSSTTPLQASDFRVIA
ncbi:Calx-beta domain-containing protein [Pantanalinema rosaneae CENA516]|uniref:Calx-beta domain-containing protein n=1 Tax=Pantanalinema rosaneae TaxID=1620701 RepID=UPI003D6DB685